MNGIVDAFFSICIEKFRFLVDEFRFGDPKKKMGGGLYRILYQNEATAIEIGLEWREQYIYVELFRLHDGKIKENPILIRPDSELNVFNLEDLIAIRDARRKLTPDYFKEPLTIESVQFVLIHYADALKDLAKDVLQGDFGVFIKLESLVKSRLVEADPVVAAYHLVEADPVVAPYYQFRDAAIDMDKVSAAAKSISHEFALILRLHIIEELGFNEIAARLGKDYSLIRTTYYRGIQKLKAKVRSANDSEEKVS